MLRRHGVQMGKRSRVALAGSLEIDGVRAEEQPRASNTVKSHPWCMPAYSNLKARAEEGLNVYPSRLSRSH